MTGPREPGISRFWVRCCASPRNDGERKQMSEQKPYRPNVGIALFNPAGQVLIGRRFRDDGPEIILPGFEWQMPQGGIDEHEDPRAAVQRELWEETGVTRADYLCETDWLTYEFQPMTAQILTGWRGFGGSARNGLRCVSSGAMRISIPCCHAMASRQSSINGDGRGLIAWLISSCRSGARSIGPWHDTSRPLRAESARPTLVRGIKSSPAHRGPAAPRNMASRQRTPQEKSDRDAAALKLLWRSLRRKKLSASPWC